MYHATCANAAFLLARRACSIVQACTIHCCRADQLAGPDISLLSPLLQCQWDHARNAYLGSIVIRPHTNMKIWWKCDQCPDGHPHEWEATVNSRSNGTACPFCANKNVCQHNSLAIQNPTIAAQFSNKNPGTAHDYTVSSNKVVIWECEYRHEWKVQISSRTSGKHGCPACFSINSKSKPKTRHPFLSDSQHTMMQKWDWEQNGKAGLDPSDIRCRSGIKANWICHQCPMGSLTGWQARVGNMYDGYGCPCCSGHQACICNSLQSLYPEVAAEWDHSRNAGTPSDYTASSHVKVWWITSKRGSFLATIHGRTGAYKDARAP